MTRYCAEADRAAGTTDPVFAAIEATKAARVASDQGWAAIPDHPGPPPWPDEVDEAQGRAEELCDAWWTAFLTLLGTRPTTPAGFKAQAEYVIADADLCSSTREALPQLRAIAQSAGRLLRVRIAA